MRFFILLTFIFLSFAGGAYAQNKALLIRKMDKSRIAVKTSDIDTVLFRKADSLPSSAYYPDTMLASAYDTVSATLPSTTGAHQYAGARISLNEDTEFAFAPFPLTISQRGSAATYGNYMLVVGKGLTFTMFNLNTRKLVATWKPSPSAMEAYDCLHSSFGKNKYLSSDPFPLLYVSSSPTESNNGRAVVKVLRLVPSSKSPTDDYNALNTEEVQTIYLPQASSSNAMGRTFYNIDPSTGKAYVLSSYDNGPTYVSQLPVPDASTKELTYNNSDILTSYKLQSSGADISGKDLKGGFIKDSRLYYAQGNGTDAACIRIVDLSSKTIVNELNLLDAGFTKEPQGVYFYHGHIMFQTTDAMQYKVYIK